MNIESVIFSNDLITFKEKNGVTGIEITTYNFNMFLECTKGCAEQLAKELLESVLNNEKKIKG